MRRTSVVASLGLVILVFIVFVSVVSAAALPYYHHLDHLSGQGVTTDSVGGAAEILDYTPYGTPRVNERVGAYQEQRKFEGQPFDPTTNLSFFKSRVLQVATGRFLSQDPRFLDPTDTELADPQRLNAYSFARNNPLRFIDEDGEAAKDFQRAVPTHPIVGRNAKPQLDRAGRPVYSFVAGDKLGAYKGVPLVSNGRNQGTGWGSLSAQCVGFVKAFYQNAFGVKIGRVYTAAAMANTTFLNAVTRSGDNHLAFVSYKNGRATERPKDDDLISWRGGLYGHVGIVASVYFDERANRGYVDVAEQNWGGAAHQSGISRHTLERNQKTGAYSIADRGSYEVQNWSRLKPKN